MLQGVENLKAHILNQFYVSRFTVFLFLTKQNRKNKINQRPHTHWLDGSVDIQGNKTAKLISNLTFPFSYYTFP